MLLRSLRLDKKWGRRFVVTLATLTFTLMLLGLPLLGVYLAGFPIDRYLQFPPKPKFLKNYYYSRYNIWFSLMSNFYQV